MTVEQLYQRVHRLGGERLELLRSIASREGICLDEHVIAPATAIDGYYPLSSAQLQFFFVEALHGPSATYHLTSIAQLDTELDPALLEQAIGVVATRHQVFRLVFELKGGRPLQRLGPSPRMEWRRVDVADRTREQIQSEIDDEISRPMSSRRGPLLRCLLLSGPGKQSILVVAMHHIISDGWSTRLLLREAGHVYACLEDGRPHRLPDPPFQYVDYAAWEQRERNVQGRSAAIASLKHKYPQGWPRVRSTDSAAGRHRHGAISNFSAPDLDWSSIARSSQANGVTPFTWLLCAFARVIGRQPWARSVPIAVPVTLRERADLDGLIGPLFNTVLVVPPEDHAAPLTEYLGQTKHAVNAALGMRHVPFEEVIRELKPTRTGSVGSMYDLMFEHLDFRNASVDPLGSEVTPLERKLSSRHTEFTLDTGATDCVLFLAVWEEDGHLAGATAYDCDQVDARFVEEFHHEYLLALEQMAGALASPRLASTDQEVDYRLATE